MVINVKIGITGSRDFKNLQKVDIEMNQILSFLSDINEDCLIITGGAQGVDKAAIDYCLKYDVPYMTIRPINPKDKISYLFRNVEIVTMSDHIIAFWNGTSRGTKFTMDYANARGKKVLVIRDD